MYTKHGAKNFALCGSNCSIFPFALCEPCERRPEARTRECLSTVPRLAGARQRGEGERESVRQREEEEEPQSALLWYFGAFSNFWVAAHTKSETLRMNTVRAPAGSCALALYSPALFTGKPTAGCERLRCVRWHAGSFRKSDLTSFS